MSDELVKAENAYIKSKDRKGYKGFYQIVVKRAIDIIACLVALPFVLLILIPVAIAIKIEDHGPLFYSSKRIGKGFKEFGMLKFRSMKVNAPDLRNDDGSTYNSKTDPRVTKIGHFLRGIVVAVESETVELAGGIDAIRVAFHIVGK